MKNFILVFILLITISVFAQTKQIKSITKVRLDKEDKQVYKTIEEFDTDSFMIKYCYYNGNFELVSFSIYSPKVNNESTETSYNDKGEIEELDTMKYDSDGELIYFARTYPLRSDDRYVDKYHFEYDDNGNITTEYRLEGDATTGGWVYNYEYNKQNQKIRMFSKYDNEPREEYTYKYKKGLLIEEKMYDFNNEELKKSDNTYWFYKYKKGRRISKKVHSVADYLKKEIINIYTYTYNKDGYVEEIIEFEDGKYDGKKVFTYTFY